MSDNVPIEIQTDIIQRITDSKSLIRCRSVSKAWKSLIDSKDFVNAHAHRHQANRHLLISKKDGFNTQVNYVSIIDDDTFPHQEVSVFVPDLIDKFSKDSLVLGCSRGLLCLYQCKTSTAVIWNPCIRKTVEIAVPNVSVFSKRHFSTVFGFGVCPRNLDPKLIKITHASDFSSLQDVNGSTQVEVFTLSSGGTWRSPLSRNLPHKLIWFEFCPAVVDGLIYWNAVDKTNLGGRYRNIIMSFDLTSEEFNKVNLPFTLDNPLALAHIHLPLYNLRESLAVLEFNRGFYHVWMLIGHGCARSFHKLYSINAPNASIHTLGFRKSGGHIIQVGCTLAIYDPESKSITNIGFHGTCDVYPHMETLLLLGH